MGSTSIFDYASLKELLGDAEAEVLLPDDGSKYKKSNKKWVGQCIKRAASLIPSLINRCFQLKSLLSDLFKLDIVIQLGLNSSFCSCLMSSRHDRYTYPWQKGK
jgi:hypothetical protein